MCIRDRHFPRPGWVEHAPEEIWQATLTATQVALDAAPDAGILAVGTAVSRWLVIPTARIPASGAASRATCVAVRVACQISSGACSTQPGRGKCWANSA